jgi:transposase InsO family protein
MFLSAMLASSVDILDFYFIGRWYFDLIHCDIWTSPVVRISCSKYYLIILDDFLHYSWTFLLCLKSDTFLTITQFFSFVSTQFGRTVKSVQCDNGCEFDNSSLRQFFLPHGMHLRMSHPYTSPKNGKVERILCTTNTNVHTLLFQASMPPQYWVESVHTATYLLNHLPTKSITASCSYTTLYNTPPTYEHLRVFGCAYYPNLSATAPHKLAPHSTLFVFIGYP